MDKFAWPRNMPAPSIELVANLLIKLCGTDEPGHRIANKIMAIIVHEIYARHDGWTAKKAADRSGYALKTYTSHYRRYGQRKYLRALAGIVLDEARAEMAISAGQATSRPHAQTSKGGTR